MYINPTATQLSSSVTGFGHTRAKSATVSAGVGNMGPPILYPAMPPFRRSLSSNSLTPMDLDIKPDVTGLGFRRGLMGNNIATSSRGTAVFGLQSVQQPSARRRRLTMSGVAPPQTIEAPIAPPSPPLMMSLEPRPTTRSGTPVNDRIPPAALVQWQREDGFWNKIGHYFMRKFEASATVYKSPFGVGATSSTDLSGSAGGGVDNMVRMQGASAIGNDEGLAGRWMTALEDERRDVVEMWKGEHPMGMRP